MWKKRQISSLLCTTYHSTAISPSSSFFLPLIPPSTFSFFVCRSSSNEPKMLFLHFRSSRLISAALEETVRAGWGTLQKLLSHAAITQPLSPRFLSTPSHPFMPGAMRPDSPSKGRQCFLVNWSV